MIRPMAAALVLSVSLTACDGSKPGTSISINTNDSDGSVVATMDGNTGAVAIDTPAFSGKIHLPRLHLDAKDFEMNGVHLYPGSSISGMHIAAQGDDDGAVRVTFASPAAPDIVRNWFQQKLTAAGFTVSPSGTGLAGKTDEGKPFDLKLTADGADASRGTIVIG